MRLKVEVKSPLSALCVLFMDEKFFATKPPEGPAGVEKYFLTEVTANGPKLNN